MRKIEILFVALSVIAFAKSRAQIPNSDFENWEPTDSVEIPSGWSVTSNIDGLPYAIGEIKDTDSYSGNYCLRLSRTSTAKITAQSKVSLDFHPQVLHGFFKPDISNKDTFWIKISLHSLGQLVDSGQWFYSGYAIPYYTPFSIPISQNGASVDSAKMPVLKVSVRILLLKAFSWFLLHLVANITSYCILRLH